MRTRTGTLLIIASLVLVACTGDQGEAQPVDELPAAALEPMAGIPSRDPASTTAPPETPLPVALLGEHGHLGPVRDGVVENTWVKWTARPSPDGSTAVLTVQPEPARTIGQTLVAWAYLPSGERKQEILTIQGVELEATAVASGAKFVALTNYADEPVGDHIAGAKETTNLLIATPDGVAYKTSLDGNFVAEAFGRRMAGNGLPAQVFLLEYFPADAPTHYRVRVLSTETGEVSLPLNLRDKTQQVDERMAGLSRSQVIANDHGLLFTLYRATDGMPDGHPYAFVHTLDLADGVWCLDVDPSLELDHRAGTLAVGGDRLYVASANGRVGAFRIPSISDPNQSPTMDWVVDVTRPGDEPPVLLADDDGVWVGENGARGSQIVRLDTTGAHGTRRPLPGPDLLAATLTPDRTVHAIGETWSTFGDVDVPDWFGQPTAILIG